MKSQNKKLKGKIFAFVLLFRIRPQFNFLKSQNISTESNDHRYHLNNKLS
uniref:Uncharacterized protein n=1 Tax=Arundo donax TaxID=35708 RepID=A0A0A9E172_ARUDO